MRLEKCQGPLFRGLEGQMRGLHFTLRTLGILLRTFIFFHWLTLAAGWAWLGKPGSLGLVLWLRRWIGSRLKWHSGSHSWTWWLSQFQIQRVILTLSSAEGHLHHLDLNGTCSCSCQQLCGLSLNQRDPVVCECLSFLCCYPCRKMKAPGVLAASF